MFSKRKARKQAQMEREANKTPEEKLKDKADYARYFLYLIGGFSLFNLFALMTDMDRIIVFCPAVPYMTLLIAQAIDEVEANSLTSVALTIGAVISLLYPLCGLICKKTPKGALIAGILMVLDTILLLILTFLFMDFWDNLMDLVSHAFMLFAIFGGWAAIKEYAEMEPVECRQNPSVLYSTDPEKF